MEKIVNHSVKVKDLGLIQFMYPDYVILDKPILFIDRPIIFTGPTRYINSIKELGVNYIIVSELSDFDLTKREVLLDIVFAHHNKNVPKYLLEFYEDLDEDLFMELVKSYWITGKWNLKEYDTMGIFLKLLQSFKTDTYQISKTYLQLLDDVGVDYIESALFTFLNRVVNPSGRLSNWYKKVIDDYSRSKYTSIKPAVDNFINSNIDNQELKVFNLILDLNKRYN